MNRSSSILIAAFVAVLGGTWIIFRFEPGSGMLDTKSANTVRRSADIQGTTEWETATPSAPDSNSDSVDGSPGQPADSARENDLISPHRSSRKIHEFPKPQFLNKPDNRTRRVSVTGSPTLDPPSRAVASGIPRASPTLQSTSVPQPAVWVDLENSPGATLGHHDQIQESANELRDKIANSGLDTTSQEYRDLWTREVDQSDRMFRQRYGVKAWLQHHVHSHHLAQPTPP